VPAAIVARSASAISAVVRSSIIVSTQYQIAVSGAAFSGWRKLMQNA
jgi:hypothetical protein